MKQNLDRMRNVKERLALTCAGIPAFYRNYLKLIGGQELFPHRNTRLMIEGFPRSANTYAWYLAQQLIPQEYIAHHVHHVASLKAASRLKTPSVILYRNPLDAVVSLAQQRKFSPDDIECMTNYLRRWCLFYEWTLDNDRNFSHVSFDVITGNPARFIQVVARLLKIPITLERARELTASADGLIRGKEGNKQATGSSLPRGERDATKGAFRDTALESPLFARAIRVFALLSERYDDFSLDSTDGGVANKGAAPGQQRPASRP